MRQSEIFFSFPSRSALPVRYARRRIAQNFSGHIFFSLSLAATAVITSDAVRVIASRFSF